MLASAVVDLWLSHARKHDVPIAFNADYMVLPHIAFVHPQADALKTLYVQLMLKRGFLATTGIYPMLAHTDHIISLYGDAIDEVFAELSEAVKKDNIISRLNGEVGDMGFARLVQ